MINFNTMPSIYWNLITKISYIQRRIIVYCIMYYESNESCISDNEYDSLSRQLVDLQKQATEEEFKATTYYYCMNDFDGSTGFDLFDRLNKKDKKYLSVIAKQVYNSWKTQEG